MGLGFKRLWNNNRKQAISVLGFLSLVFLCLWHCVNVMAYQENEDEYRTDLKTNEEAAIYTLKDQMNVLKGFEELYQLSFEAYEQERNFGTIIIPGMISTKTLKENQNIKNYEMSLCTSMTPQGLCITDQYILISAYCHTGIHNSVIYVLDKKTHKFIKEVILDGRPHAGGLAYDKENQILWVSTGKKGEASATAISMEILEKYDVDTCVKPIEYKYEYDLHAIERDSFMACEDGYLYIGFFNVKGYGVVQKYRMNQEGGLITTLDTEYGTQKSIALPEVIKKIPNKAQGIAFYKDRVIITLSYGLQKSKMIVYDSSKSWHHVNEDHVINQIIMPQMLEQVYIDGDNVYVLFESAAEAYRAQPIPKVDRILKLDLKKVVKEKNKTPRK